MKDHAQRRPLARVKAADTVAHLGAIVTTPARDGAVAHRKDHGVPKRQRHHLGPTLLTRALLGEHELTAGEIVAGP